MTSRIGRRRREKRHKRFNVIRGLRRRMGLSDATAEPLSLCDYAKAPRSGMMVPRSSYDPVPDIAGLLAQENEAMRDTFQGVPIVQEDPILSTEELRAGPIYKDRFVWDMDPKPIRDLVRELNLPEKHVIAHDRP